MVVYDKSGKRSEKKIFLIKYKKNSKNTFTLTLKTQGGLPVRRFIDGDDKLINKDLNNQNIKKNLKNKSIDLHGYTLENANKTIRDFINKCFLEEVTSIKVITGKGSRSKNKEDPYLSTDLSILKYSVPNYIKNDYELMKKIKKLDFNSVNDISQGSFDILLNKKL